jgi:hypothetical protein
MPAIYRELPRREHLRPPSLLLPSPVSFAQRRARIHAYLLPAVAVVL